MLMDELAPRFSDFFEKEILPGNYDYIVPIETKGMLLLEEIMKVKEYSTARSKLISRRGLDFIADEVLREKKIALVDDMLVMGRTLNKSAEQLEKRGIRNVNKYVFIVSESERSKRFRRIKGINFDSIINEEQFILMLEEFSNLSLRERPTSPDHFDIRVDLENRIAPHTMVGILCNYGDVVEYRSSGRWKVLSVHFPSFIPKTTEYAIDSGSNKVRVRLSMDGLRLELCPEFFPAMDSEKYKNDNRFIERVRSFLERPWHSEEVRRKNLYEAFSLDWRVRAGRGFLKTLVEEGLRVKRIEIDKARLPIYYGNSTSEEIVKLLSTDINEFEKEDVQEGSQNPKYNHDEYFNMNQSSFEILNILYNEYVETNRQEEDEYEWRSVGMNLESLSKRSGYGKHEVSACVELLNDYGYSTPFVKEHDNVFFLERTYRSTEVGETRLRT